jgi:hypothetical protein
MSKILVFTHNAKANETTLVKRCMDLLESEYVVLNIHQHTPKSHVNTGDTVIAFGQVPFMMIEQYRQEKELDISIIQLPAPKSLTKTVGNENNRYETFKTLNELKISLQEQRYQPRNIKITSEDLPELERQHVLMLKKMTEENNHVSCFQVTKNGQTIQIGNVPLVEQKTDRYISFQELYTIRQIMDVLKINEVELINKNSEEKTCK